MDHTSSVKLGGDSTEAQAAFAKAADGANKYTGSVAKAGKATEVFTGATSKARNSTEGFLKALDKTKASTDKMSASGVKASTVAMGFGKAAQAAQGGITGVAQSALAAATAFGPWGVAIGLVGSALIGYVNDAKAAEKATHDLGVEAVKRVRDARILREQEARDAADERKGEQEKAFQQSKREAEIMGRRGDLRSIEDALDQHGRGKDNIALLREEAKILADNALTMGDVAGSEQIIRDSEREINQLLHAQDKTRKSIAKTVKETAFDENRRLKKQSPGFGRNDDRAAGFDSRGSAGFNSRAEEREWEEFGAGLKAANNAPTLSKDTRSQMRRDVDLGPAEANTAAQLRAIEIQRATTGETIDLINQEEAARRSLLQLQKESTVDIVEKMALQGEMEQVEHEAALARIEQRRAAEEAAMAKRVEWADVSAGLASGGIQTANMVAAASGASAKKQEKIAGRLAGIQAMFVGGLEMVKSAAAFASLNIPQGIAHAAAGAFAFVQGGLMLSGAMPSGAGGGGGGSAPPEPAPASQPSGGSQGGYTGPIPGSPSPGTPSSSTSTGPTGGTTVIQFNGDFYGTPKREFWRMADQELGQLRNHNRPRRDS